MKRRLKSCVENWPEAVTGEYHPKCCRFPKSCSADVYDEEFVTEEELEDRVMPLPQEEIDNRTGYHAGTDVTMPSHKVIRQKYNDLMTAMNLLLPDGRAKSVCLTQLEDSEMWANKAVAELAPLVRE